MSKPNPFSFHRPFRRAAGVLALVAGVGLTGCGGGGGSPFDPLTTDPEFPGVAGDPTTHANLFQFQAVPGCTPATTTDLATTTALRIFRGPGVSDATLASYLGGLQRYYSQYGVTFTTAFDVITVPINETMIFDLNLLVARVKSTTGIDLNRTDPDTLPAADQDRVLAALGEAIMHNVREFLRVYSKPRLADINVVVLPDMVSKNLDPSLMQYSGILGMGVSPELLAMFQPSDPASMLYDWLDVHEDFTPTAFVGVRPVDQYLSYPDVAIAHEVGHAYGLAHVDTSGNPLHQGEIDCQLGLDTSQLDRIRIAAAALSDTVDLESLSLTSRGGALVADLRRLMAAWPTRR